MISAKHHWNRINEYFSMNYTKNNFSKMSNLGKVILFSPMYEMIQMNMIILRSIQRYSTASTSEAAYIIGGWHTRSIIAEFKNDAWSQLGTLGKGRAYHGSISLGNEFMVIGGWSSDDRLVYF